MAFHLALQALKAAFQESTMISKFSIEIHYERYNQTTI